MVFNVANILFPHPLLLLIPHVKWAGFFMVIAVAEPVWFYILSHTKDNSPQVFKHCFSVYHSHSFKGNILLVTCCVSHLWLTRFKVLRGNLKWGLIKPKMHGIFTTLKSWWWCFLSAKICEIHNLNAEQSGTKRIGVSHLFAVNKLHTV